MAAKTIQRPSGETAMDVPLMNVRCSEGPTSKRTACLGAAFRHGAHIASPTPAAITARAATAGQSHFGRFCDGAIGCIPLTLLMLAEALVGPARSISSSVGL